MLNKALAILFENSFDIEVIHQSVLITLFRNSDLANGLFKAELAIECQWEPKGGLFDLAIIDNDTEYYIELKMWSSLGTGQLERQKAFINDNGGNLIYILLGLSHFEHDNGTLPGSRIGYSQLDAALQRVIEAGNHSDPVKDLAAVYKESLRVQFENLIDGHNRLAPEYGPRYYYPLFANIRARLRDTSASIFSVNNAGQTVSILQCDEYLHLVVCDEPCQVYYEVCNDKLNFKFHSETTVEKKKLIREKLRAAIHDILDGEIAIIDSGRIGTYMSISHFAHDFSSVNNLEQSAKLFALALTALRNIESRL